MRSIERAVRRRKLPEVSSSPWFLLLLRKRGARESVRAAR